MEFHKFVQAMDVEAINTVGERTVRLPPLYNSWNACHTRLDAPTTGDFQYRSCQKGLNWLEKKSICSFVCNAFKNDAKELEEVAKIASLLVVALAKANATNTEDLVSNP
jgi:hypothetical protein